MWLYEAKPICRLPEAAEGQVLGAVNGTHTAFADLGLNFKMSELGANHGRWMVFAQRQGRAIPHQDNYTRRRKHWNI